MFIDCYGNKGEGSEYRQVKQIPTLVQTSGNITYVGFDDVNPCPVWKIEKDIVTGITVQKWAYGLWNDRLTLTYSARMNEPIVIA